MCGLVVVVNFLGDPVDSRQLKRMTDTIRHRGPDDEGFFTKGPIGFGFRRLSILDLSPAGHQPMTVADGQVTIVFNGEIFNYVELRKELTALGHHFVSSGDTEVLLHAYLEWGHDCLPRLNGMWAFAIYDNRTGKIFGSRDRFGIKQLYRYRDSEQVLFASEIKSIRLADCYRHQTNWTVAADYLLRDRLDETDETFFAGIEKVGPGCAFELDLAGSYREWRYWSLPQFEEGYAANPAQEYDELFESAMALHMRSDVPVGVHLSGGLDSSAIVCAASRLRQQAGAVDPIRAFSFSADGYDESQYIKATVAQSQARVELLMRDANSLWDTLPRLLRHHDEPVHSMAPVVGYQLMEMTARAGIKVVLNGQGADETAAGYGSYFTNYWQSMFSQSQYQQAWHEIGAYAAGHGLNGKKLYLEQLAFYGRSLFSRLPAYRSLSRRRAVAHLHANPWLSGDLAGLIAINTSRPNYQLQPTLESAVTMAPLPLYLRIEDRNASAHSIESRVPFLDYRLVEFLFKLTDNWRIRGPWNKYVQREGLKGRIPEIVRTRIDKMGFTTGRQNWFVSELYEPLHMLFSSQKTRERGLFRTEQIIKELERIKAGVSATDTPIFKLAQFELWCRLVENKQNENEFVAGRRC
jgi:asparagine synthase (glutamine-hydrolysing)